jgi:hypothetical protein
MKNLFFIPISFFVLFATNIYGSETSKATNTTFTHCIWDAWFKYPTHNQSYPAGKDIYVKVNPKKYQDIAYMELYINGQYIRKESHYPYEWAKPNSSGDQPLRNMNPGTYQLKVKIRDKCGQTNYKHLTFYIKGGGGGNTCHFTNPLSELNWLKNFKSQYPNYVICEYKKNGKTYFKIFPCGQNHCTIYWYDCHGNKVCQVQSGHSTPQIVQGAHKVKCWWTPCNTGNDNCEWQSWFKYPYKNATYPKGADVYVRVDTKKFQDIAYIQLYINGKFVRKESYSPYEWAKGSGNSDHYLRNMHPGNYKLVAKIKDKCGKYHEIETWFTVHGSLSN